MNSDISRIPIQSLGAVVSLTDIVPELPLPSPSQDCSSSETLLSDPDLSLHVSRCLSYENDHLISTISAALETVCTDNIELNDGLDGDSFDPNGVPPLLIAVLLKNKTLLQNKLGFRQLSACLSKPRQISGHLNNEQGHSTPGDSIHPIDSHATLNCTKEHACSPGRTKKKKKKKRKHKHRESGDGDTSGTGGDSNATTPADATVGGSTPLSKSGESSLSPTVPATYGVVADKTKLSLKIFRRPAFEHQLATGNSTTDLSKKEKKKKRSKERTRENKFVPQVNHTGGEVHPGEFINSDLTNGLVVSTAGNNGSTQRLPSTSGVDSSSSTTSVGPFYDKPSKGQLPCEIPEATFLPDMPRGCQNSVPAMDSGTGLFEPSSLIHPAYRPPAGPPAPPSSSSFLVDRLSTDDPFSPSTSVAAAINQMVASRSYSPTTQQSMLFCTNEPSSNPITSTSSRSTNGTTNTCTLIEYASHVLQNELCEVLSLPLTAPTTETGSEAATVLSSMDEPSSLDHQNQASILTQFMMAFPNVMPPDGFSDGTATGDGVVGCCDHLPVDSSSPSLHTFDLPGFSAPMAGEMSSVSALDYAIGNSIATPATAGSHHLPMGLARYLAGGQKPQQQQQPPQQRMKVNRSTAPAATTSTPQPWWKRTGASMNRRRRRRNEVEDLQSWTVNYPTNVGPTGSKTAERGAVHEERTWDEAIGSYSQVLGERAKRRKRMARQTGTFDSDYVFEHDSEYHAGDGGLSTNGGLPADEYSTTGENDERCAARANDSETDLSGSRGTRSGAAHRSYVGMDDGEEEDGCAGITFPGSADGSRRRKKAVDDDEPFEIRLKEPIEARFPHLSRKSNDAVRKRRERVGFGTGPGQSSVPPRPRHPLDPSTVSAEAGCLKRFQHRLRNVLDAVEEADLLPAFADRPNADGVGAADNTTATPAEALISTEDLLELCRDAAKLNATGTANQLSTDKLVKLLTVLLLNVRDGAAVIATLRTDEETDEQDNRLWRELAMERVMRSVNAGLTGLQLMTAPDMPREVYVEDVIERTVNTVRFQLFNSIYPEFDPAYRVENSAKETQSSIRSRRARERDLHKPRAVTQLYHKLVEIVANLAKLVSMQRLTDGLVLSLSSVGVSAFFVENVSELQLASLDLVTAIFAHYEPHRKLIMEEILASLAKLPSSKRNLRSYRLNSEDNIQMLTALSLLLVQSVIVLPTANSNSKLGITPVGAVSEANQVVPDSGANPALPLANNLASAQKADDEVLVTTSYQNALRTAHTFLLVFLRKSTIKGEDDYRVIFENFVNDLLLAVNKPEWPAAEVMLSLLGSLLVQQFNNKLLDQTIRVASVDYLGTVASTLRRDAVTGQLKENAISAVIRDLLEGNRSDDDDEDEDEVEEEEEEEGDQEGKPSLSQVKEEEQEGLPDSKPGMPNDYETGQTLVGEINEGGPIFNDHTGGFDQAYSDQTKSEGNQQLPYQKTTSSTSKRKCSKVKRKNRRIDPIAQLDRVQVLRDAILDYLAAEDSSPTALYARKFYLAQWLNDCTKETERAQRAATSSTGDRFGIDSTGGSEVEGSGGGLSSQQQRLSATDREAVLALSERRRQHILAKIREPPDSWRQRRRQLWSNCSLAVSANLGHRTHSRQAHSGGRDACVDELVPLVFRGTLDYEDGCLVCRYLANLRPFSQSFDVYLSQICKLLSESSVAVRTKALRCLSAVVEADPNVLARVDIERAVNSRLLDTSTSVREAAVDLLGRFLGRKPELTAQYYPMLADRMLDKGVSVRKRVIRILRDICLEQPEFPKVAEICVKMIRRVNDEEGIKKLVNEVFQAMWFSPVREKETVKLLRKVMNITDVVAACKETGSEWFEQFLQSLLKKEESEKLKPVEKACRQIVDCLVQNIMRLEEISSQNNQQRLVACIATLHMLTRIRPDLMVQYTTVLQTYLRCNEASDASVLHYVARILEVTVPRMEHPSETFVAQLEEDMVRLTLRHGKMVLESCVACLGAVVNRVSKNYSLARDCFSRFFGALQRFRNELSEHPERKVSPKIRPSILRALFTVGLLCKHFDAEVFQTGTDSNVLDQVFEILMFFTEEVKSDLEMRKKALSGMGFLCTRHHELLCGARLRDFYRMLLQSTVDSVRPLPSTSPEAGGDFQKPSGCRPVVTGGQHHLELKCIVLENLLNFFLDEEKRMLDADAKWKSRQHQESLKEMGDVASGMGSCVAQTYLGDTLECFFSFNVNVRLTSLSVVSTILRQGLIHPVQTVPYLIALQTDVDLNVRTKADAQLQDINHKFPGYLSMRAIRGVNYSFRLQSMMYPELLELAKLKAGAEPSLTNENSSSQQQLLSPNNNNNSSLSRGGAPTAVLRRSARHNRSDQSDSVDGSSTVCGTDDPTTSRRTNSPHHPHQVPEDSTTIEAIRGVRDPNCEIPSALNSNVYSMLRSNRGQRRSFLSGLIDLFDDSQSNNRTDSRTPLSLLVYIADNLAHFPYQTQEEPLFIVHHIDLLVSIAGANVLHNVRDSLFPELKPALDAALAHTTTVNAAAAAPHANPLHMMSAILPQNSFQALQMPQQQPQLIGGLAHQQQGQQYQQLMASGLFHLPMETTGFPHLVPGLVAAEGVHANQLGSPTHFAPTGAGLAAPTGVLAGPPAVAPLAPGGTSHMNELRSVALVGRDALTHTELGSLEEEEEDADALLHRLSLSRASSLPVVRDAIRASRACVLLLTLKQYLKEVYSITDSKVQRYSPTDQVKLWEKPLTRRAGVRFHPGPCLRLAAAEMRTPTSHFNGSRGKAGVSGADLSSSLSVGNDSFGPLETTKSDTAEATSEELYEGEMLALVHEYMEFRNLILTIDPIDDDELGNGGGAGVGTAAVGVVGPEDLTASLASDSTVMQLPASSQLMSIMPNHGGVPIAIASPVGPVLPAQVGALRHRPIRTLVPQSHCKSSDEDNDSEDSNAGGASRLMLAQSAPSRRKKTSSSRTASSRVGMANRVSSKQKKRKRRKRFTMNASSSSDETDSAAGDTDASDAEY